MISEYSDRFNLPPIEVIKKLVNTVKIESIDSYNPVVVAKTPQPWQLLGTGNYAGVFQHPHYDSVVIKIYAPGRSGWVEEVEVYRRLGYHQAFSQCFYAEPNWLVLKRLNGVTLYDSLHLGLKIPRQVIQDIDLALEYAISKGLTPHDVHGKNVMMSEGKGLVVDVSDFLNSSPCWAWRDLKKAYYWLYQPLFSWHRLNVSYQILDLVRGSYRFYRSLTKVRVKKNVSSKLRA
jgi:hypothetical protein